MLEPKAIELDSSLRGLLERTVIKAREAAEHAADVALTSLNIKPNGNDPAALVGEKDLRRLLLAKKKQLGGYKRLKEECAYEHWHRMLFARFLEQNGLLMHPEGVPVTFEDCEDFLEAGDRDAWDVASRYAAISLPGIFRQDDPLLSLRLPPEGRQSLESLLEGLPPEVFQSGDAIGWVYQFWQSQRKAEINASGEKIGADELPAVTQLFTEGYMVKFLLQNTLGAWWACKYPGHELCDKWEYMLWNEDGSPAVGSFPGWPNRVTELKVMDPCCGSGHFLVEAFHMLREMQMVEEDLSEADAGDAVLSDNLHGLEIDERCIQLATFTLTLEAWKAGGYRQLPIPNLACSGLRLNANREEWVALAKQDGSLEMALSHLYDQFKDASELGSLIQPKDEEDQNSLFGVEWTEVSGLLDKASQYEATDPVTAVFGQTASGLSRAANLLNKKYHFVVTNVPYLGRSKQSNVLMNHCKSKYFNSKPDLATTFVERCKSLCDLNGIYSVVTPQNWLFLGRYKELRKDLLKNQSWIFVAKLGPAAFRDMNWWAANTMLLTLCNNAPKLEQQIIGVDVSETRNPQLKADLLKGSPLIYIDQQTQLSNPDARVVFDKGDQGLPLLADYCKAPVGIMTGDTPRHLRLFWELAIVSHPWKYCQTTGKSNVPYHGYELIVEWCDENGKYPYETNHVIVGRDAWGRKGVAVSIMNQLKSWLYIGDIFDKNIAILVPNKEDHLPAIWAYCQSPEYLENVRRLDQKVAVTNKTLIKVPFDLEHWQKVAEGMGPISEPHSDDPTQWLFKGNVIGAVPQSDLTITAPLHVAVSRLLGYRWPEQISNPQDILVDPDGIVCLPSVAGERPCAERLRAFLAAAFGVEWRPALMERLLADEGYNGKDLEVWLLDGFFSNHCKLFQQRPFLWHVWDGRKDGFSAIVNYHSLDRSKLEKLTYTYLGDWIARQKLDQQSGIAGADGRLVAALDLQKKLQAILHGEPPYDLYVRWKPLHEQPIGWEPDLNDGVRMNIRPFVTAGILRGKVNVNWKPDRGKNPDGSERINDCHYTRTEKEQARLRHQAKQ